MTSLQKPLMLTISRQGTRGVPATSDDGITWHALPLTTSPSLEEGQLNGYFLGSDRTLTVVTLELSLFDLMKKQYNLFVKSEKRSLAIGGSTTLTFRGGTGTGAVTFATSTPAICSLTPNGFLTGLAIGECLVRVSKGHDGNYMNARSAALAITVRS